LTSRIKSYKRQLHKQVLEVTSVPPPVTAAAAAAAAVPAVAPAAAAGAKKAAAAGAGGAAGGKGSGKDKPVREDDREEAAWLPAVPVFPAELNQQWQQLLQEVRRRAALGFRK
jgi:hypothetical protein